MFNSVYLWVSSLQSLIKRVNTPLHESSSDVCSEVCHAWTTMWRSRRVLSEQRSGLVSGASHEAVSHSCDLDGWHVPGSKRAQQIQYCNNRGASCLKIILCRFLSHALVFTFPAPVNLISWLLLFASPNVFLLLSRDITSLFLCALFIYLRVQFYLFLHLLSYISNSLSAQSFKWRRYLGFFLSHCSLFCLSGYLDMLTNQ